MRYLSSQLAFGVSEMADPSRIIQRATLRVGGVLGFFGGFLFAYQRSSCQFSHSIVDIAGLTFAYGKSDSGGGLKTNERKKGISKNSVSLPMKVNLSTANPLNRNGCKELHIGILHFLNLNFVSCLAPLLHCFY
jgi:hypothetical protein